MSVYVPEHEDWHDFLPDYCRCDSGWAERNMVDDRCWFHRMVEVVGWLREAGWTVVFPMPEETQCPTCGGRQMVPVDSLGGVTFSGGGLLACLDCTEVTP